MRPGSARERRSGLLQCFIALLRLRDSVALGRGLLQTPTVTYVTTTVEFVEAAERGDPHIEILKHLDFGDTDLKQLDNNLASNATVHVGSAVRSIRGNCQDSFPSLADVPSIASGPELWPQKPGQCLLSGFAGSGIIISQPEGFPCWIDNVYMREGDGLNNMEPFLPAVLGMFKWHKSTEVTEDITFGYFTNVTLQMNSVSETLPFGVNTRAYMEDGLILHSRGIAAYVGMKGATAWLRNCEISHAEAYPRSPIMRAGSFVPGFSGAAGLILQSMTYTQVDATGDVQAFNGSQVFSDQKERVFHYFDTGTDDMGRNGEYKLAKSISEASNSSLQFISWDDAQDLVKEAEAARKRSPPPPVTPAAVQPSPISTESCEGNSSTSNSSLASCGGSEDDSGISIGAVGAIVTCAVAAVALAVLAAVCFFRRRRTKQQKAKMDSCEASLTATTVTTGGATKAKPHVKPNAERLDTPQDITTSSTPSLGAISHQGRATTETPSMVGPPGTPPRWRVHQDPASTMSGNPSQMASMYGPEALEGQVLQALEYICGAKQLLAGRYELRGPPLPPSGSFGIVQLANIANLHGYLTDASGQKTASLQDAVAVKIFTDPVGFVNEKRIYSLPALTTQFDRKPVFMDNIDGATVMPSGWPFPPFTVSDRGQSLEVWLKSYTADAITAVQILGQVLKAVVALHGAGLAHRNIKPSNILQRSQQHDWILSDFAASCPFGASAPLPNSGASAAYMAPEVFASVGNSRPPSAVASPEADMWAVGLLSFELLTGERVFPEGTPLSTVHATLRGKTLFPWEEGAANAAKNKEKLRGLQRLVMPCLSRNPKQRPSAKAAITSFHSMFDNMKTRGTFERDEDSKT